MGRAILIAICGVVAALAVAVAGLYIMANRWLASDAFRTWASAEVSKALGVEGEFQPPRWSQSTVYSEGFVGQGQPDGGVSAIRAEQVRAQFDPRGIFQGAWRLDTLTVGRVTIDLGLKQPGSLGAPQTERRREEISAVSRRKRAWKISLPWFPKRFEMRQVKVESFDLRWPAGSNGIGSLVGTAVDAVPKGRTWEFHGKGGTLRYPGAPDMAVTGFNVRLDWPMLYVTTADVALKEGRQGAVSVSGEANCDGDRPVDLNVRVDGLPVDRFLPEDWRARLEGRLSGKARFSGPTRRGDEFQADGELRVVDGQVSALPVLDEIASLTGTDAFRKFKLDRADAKVHWSGGKLVFEDIWIESHGLLRINGTVSDYGGMIEGALEVGTTEDRLKLIPGARRHVFTREADGYVWAQSGVKLSGTRDQIQEDLTPRLASGAVREVQENIGGAVRGMLDIIDKVIR